MYVTGGIGSSGSNEGFTKAYDLPNDTAYCETCAAIGMALWAHRMFLLTGETKYADVLEREVYNNVPAGVSWSGNRFFYDNPLASRRPRARPWFECVVLSAERRALPARDGRAHVRRARPRVHAILYAASTASSRSAAGRSDRPGDGLPASGNVRIKRAAAGTVQFALRLRVPAGARRRRRARDGALAQPREPGRRVRDRDGVDGRRRRARPRMPPRRVPRRPTVEMDAAVSRSRAGPVVYALEAADHAGQRVSLALPAERELSERLGSVRFGGTTLLRPPGRHGLRDEPVRPLDARADLVAIPYCLWANRGRRDGRLDPGGSAAPRRVPAAGSAIHDGTSIGLALLAGDTLAALRRAGAEELERRLDPAAHFWDHRARRSGSSSTSTREADPAARVYWFDDRRARDCASARARVLVRVGDAWRIRAPSSRR
jgi:DUF1680 family protein